MHIRWAWGLAATLSLLISCANPASKATDPGVATAAPPAPAVPTPAAPAPTSEEPVKAPASLEWDLALDHNGGALKITYTVTSRTDHTIYLADLLPVAGQGGFVWGDKAMIVMNSDKPDTVRFARGRVRSEAPVIVPLDPGARALEPGGTASGEALVPLPLKATHYHGTTAALKGGFKYAELEIGYLDGEVHWTSMPLADGRSMTVSSPVDPMGVIRGEPKPLP